MKSEKIPEKKTEKKYTFRTETEREVGVCIAIQKKGLASIQDIIAKIEFWGGKLTEKQATKTAENLRRRELLSIDLTEKNDDGISIKRYAMKRIKFSVPEIAQIRDLIDDASFNPLKEELERSKKTRKKGLKTFDYYTVDVILKTRGLVQGFIPDEKGIVRHYRKNGKVIFAPYHFRNWMRNNLPLINRASSAVGDIHFSYGTTQVNGDTQIQEKYITNIESGFSSSHGTGGRGVRKVECLPEDSVIQTQFTIPREFVSPDKIQKALDIMCKLGIAFGGGAKLSTGHLTLDKLSICNEQIWVED